MKLMMKAREVTALQSVKKINIANLGTEKKVFFCASSSPIVLDGSTTGIGRRVRNDNVVVY